MKKELDIKLKKDNDSISIKKYLTNKTEIKMVVQFCGKDINVSVFGGDSPHIGAVALAVANIDGYSRKYSPTVSVLNVMDHKDDEIAKIIAKDLSKEFNIQVVAVVGIHINDIKESEFEEIFLNITEMLQSIKDEIEKINQKH